MSYPTLDTSYGSAEKVLAGRQIDRATNGAPKARVLFSAQKKVFNLVHPEITIAERATFDAFYAANQTNSFSFVWLGDGATYTCIFGEDEPQYIKVPVNRWTITVQLVQV